MEIRMQSPVGARVVFNGRECDYFSGTGYLGLQSHPEVIQAATEAIQRYGLFTGTSRGGYGESPLYDELESEACAYFGVEKVVYYASGYLGMLILTQTNRTGYEHIFIDESSHFSIWDGSQATNRQITPFHHCNPQHLAETLRRELLPGERPLVLSDGVFPISGEIAPLPDYVKLAESYGGMVYIDDAHAVGVLGEHGRGTMDYYNLDTTSCRFACTLSKALGGYGGLIPGKAGWIDNIDRNARVLVGASPPPLVVAAASARALSLARRDPSIRQRLQSNVKHARDGLRALGWSMADTPVPILCLGVRPGINLERLKAALFERDICVAHVRNYSSTPPGGALRIAIFATHTFEQIDRLVGEMGILI